MLSDAFVRVLAGPIGAGKSVACVHELLRWMSLQAPNAAGERKSRFLVCRNTLDQLKSTTMKTVFDWIPPGAAGDYKVSDKTFFINAALPDGTRVKSELLFIAFDTPDDVRKALSLETTGLWGNESRELHPEVVDGLLSRVDRYPSMKDGGATRAGAIFDTNMPQDDTWWQEKMDSPPVNWHVSVQPPAVLPWEEWKTRFGAEPDEALTGADIDGDRYAVNPGGDNLSNLSPTYYPNIIVGKSKDFIGVYLRCQYGRGLSGLPVFGAFKPDFHVSASPLIPISNTARPVLIGMDFGLTPAAVFGQLDARGRLLILDEAVEMDMGVSRFIPERLRPALNSRFPGSSAVVIGDPAGGARSQVDERSVFDVFHGFGLRAIPARTNSVSARVAAVETFLTRQVDGGAGMLVDPRCRSLIAALRGRYRYRIKRTGEREFTPEKNEASHVADALQYLALHADAQQGGRSLRGVKREIRQESALGWT
jgi:hypothetical protein